MPTKGLIEKGPGLLSGLGSTEITTVLFLKSNGNVNPSGSLLK